MPEKKTVIPVSRDTNFNRTDYVKAQVEEFRSYIEKELVVIDNIPDTHFQCICIYAYIDALAAENSAYKHESLESNIFTDFILCCDTRYDYLDKIEPVTLYYHIEEHMNKSCASPEKPAKLDIDIKNFNWDHILFSDAVKTKFSNELIEYMLKVKGEDYTKKMKKEHRLVNLLYRMRSKLVHEMSSPGLDRPFDNSCKFVAPYYCEYGRIYCEENVLVTDEVIELRIPYIFIRNILEDCANHYLEECIRLNRIPFGYNKMTRPHVLSWYDN